MISDKEINEFRKLVYEHGLIDENKGNAIRFSDKAERIIKKDIPTGWVYFVFDSVEQNYVHFWMPKFYATKSIHKKECWKFVKTENLTKELIDAFCKFFEIKTEENKFVVASEIEFMDI